MPFPTQFNRSLPSYLANRWLRIGLGVVGCLSIVSGGAAFWLLGYVRSQLVPLIQAEIQDVIDRPVQLGEIERLSLTGFRLGQSAIPATQTDSDQVNIPAIEIGFNPIDALMTRQVDLTVTLVQPQLFLEQNAKGDWLATEIQFERGSAIDVKEIRLRDAKVILAPSLDYAQSLKKPDRTETGAIPHRALPPSRLLIDRLNGSVQLMNDAEHFRFNATAEADTGGFLQLQGEADQPTETLTAKVTTKDLAIAPWITMLPIPVSVESGTVSSQLQAQIRSQQPFALKGKIQIRDGRARAVGEPNPFSDINGRLKLDGQKIYIEQGHLQFGKIPFDVVGSIDLENGLDLKAKVASVSTADFMQTFKLKLPFPVTGSLRSHQVNVKGAFDHVIFSGTAEAAQPLQLDRVPMAAAKAAFTLDKSTDRLTLKDIEFTPTSGGQITTNAQITLENDDAPLNVTVEASDISADAIAQLYSLSNRLSDPRLNQLLTQLTNRSSDEPLKLGRVNAQVNVAGTGNDPQITGQWQLAQGDFPAAGKLQFAHETLQVQDTIVQVAEGTLRAAGQLKDGDWQATVSGEDLQLAGGTVQVDGRLAAGQWQATIAAEAMRLGKIVSTLPDRLSSAANSNLSGKIVLAGQLQNPAAMKATGSLQLSETGFIDAPITADLQWQDDRLHILSAGTTGIALKGWMTPRLTGKPTIEEMDLAVQIDPIDLKPTADSLSRQFAVSLPKFLQLDGMAGFTGHLRGNAAVPQLTGKLQLNNLMLNGLQFAPIVAGDVAWTEAGFQVDLAGQRNLQKSTQNIKSVSDRFQVQFDRTLKTGSISLKLDQATAQAHYSDGYVMGQLNNLSMPQIQSLASLPQSEISLPPDLVNSQLSAQYNINFRQSDRPRAIAEVKIANAGKGETSDQLTGTVSYIDGTATVKQAELRLGDSRYTVNGQFTPDRDSEFAAQISVKQGQIRHLWQAVKVLEQTQWLTDRSLLNSLQTNLSGIDPAALKGEFGAEIAVQGAGQTGIKSSFQIQGQNWAWKQYGIQQISAAGQFDGAQVQLMPLQLAGFTYTPNSGTPQIFDTKLSVSGLYSARSQQGQIALEKMPVALIKNWLNTEAPVEGELNASANISGNNAAPQIDGEFKLSQLRLSQNTLPDAHLRFQYAGDQFKVGGVSTMQSVKPESADSESELETLYFKLGFIDFTLPIDVLNTFVTTGSVQEPLGFYAQFLDTQTLQTVRSILSQPLDSHRIDLAAIATSESGEAWLQWVGDLIQTHEGNNGKTIVQSAILSAAAEKPTGITVMDILHHIPARKLRINTGAVVNLLKPPS